MKPGQPILDVRGLTIRIGNRTLLSGLSVRVDPGQVWCVLGANGVGKTTFLDTVVGLRRHEAGSIHLAGKALREWSPVDAAQVRGYLPQGIRDAFSARVLEVVLMGRHPHLSRWGWEGEPERLTAMKALQIVGMSEMADRDVTTLSGGERQRVAVAALIAQETPLLLLDEPVSHLDLHHQSMVLGHLRALALEDQRAIVFTVHDLNLAARFATHAMLFHEGGAVDAGPIDEVLNERALSVALQCRIARIQVDGQTIFLAN